MTLVAILTRDRTLLAIAVTAASMCLPVISAAQEKSLHNEFREPVTVISKDGELHSPITVLFGRVEVPGTASSVDVRAYGITRPDKNDPAKSRPLIPGATFVFRPGDTLHLTLENYLNRLTNPALNQFEDTPKVGSGPGTAEGAVTESVFQVASVSQ